MDRSLDPKVPRLLLWRTGAAPSPAAEGIAQETEVLEVACGRKRGDTQPILWVVLRECHDDLREPIAGAIDGAVLLDRPLRPEHGQAQFESAKLASTEPHRSQKVVRDDRDLVVRFDVNLEPFDEAAGHLEPLRDRLDVLEQHVALHAGLACDLGNRMRLAVREHRDEVEYAAELRRGVVGHERWWAKVSRTSPRYSSTKVRGSMGWSSPANESSKRAKASSRRT